jgi:hypothetical protein
MGVIIMGLHGSPIEAESIRPMVCVNLHAARIGLLVVRLQNQRLVGGADPRYLHQSFECLKADVP